MALRGVGMHRVNAGYTVLARLRADRIEDARTMIAALQLPFEDALTVHFATISVLPAEQYGDQELPATLLFATSIAGPAEVHVAELVGLMAEPLARLFACCDGFDGDVAAFLVEHRHPDTFYSGMQHLTPTDVVNHAKLRDAIEAYLDGPQRLATTDPGRLHRAIRSHIESLPGFEWVRESTTLAPGTFLALHGRTVLAVAGFAAVLVASLACGWWGPLAVVGVLAVVVGGMLVAVREAEKQQTFVASRALDEDVRRLAATQNRAVINEMTIAGPVKEEGAVRPTFMRLALWVIARLAEGIPLLRAPIDIPTVAAARWIAADQGRRLIFISNFTNAAEPYVRDFIDVPDGAKRINLTFGFGRGYPKTRWVMGGGALDDPNAFIYVVNQNQKLTGYWYGRYRNLSIDNIKTNREIREKLCADLDAKQAQAWLHLL